jgi:hypothetical protein
VVDQPSRLTGHWAAATPLFTQLYGGCMLAFLDASQRDVDTMCGGGTHWVGTSPAAPQQIVSGRAAPVAAVTR